MLKCSVVLYIQRSLISSIENPNGKEYIPPRSFSLNCRRTYSIALLNSSRSMLVCWFVQEARMSSVFSAIALFHI